jgi:hypothetical protein
VIASFRPHSASGGGGDTIDVSGLPETSLTFMKLFGHISQSGADVVITDGLGSFLTLTNTSLASLTSADFIF